MWSRILFALVFLAQSVPASSQGNTMTLVVGFAPGGTSSIAARQLGEAIKRVSPYQVVVLNKEGAVGRLAADFVSRQDDSRTLLFFSSSSVPRVPPSEDLVPVALVARYNYVVAVKSGAPSTLSEYFRVAKHDTSLRDVGTPGTGSTSHVVGSKLFRQWGVPMLHVPYNGGKPTIIDLRGGFISMGIVPHTDFLSQAEDQKLRLIAETGNGIAIGGWLGVYAPKSISSADRKQFEELFRIASENSREKFTSFGLRQEWKPGVEFGAMHRRYYEEDVGRSWIFLASSSEPHTSIR